MVEFAFLMLGFFIFAGTIAYLLARGLHRDTWSYDDRNVWVHIDAKKNTDR
jgi:hypothetical protein